MNLRLYLVLCLTTSAFSSASFATYIEPDSDTEIFKFSDTWGENEELTTIPEDHLLEPNTLFFSEYDLDLSELKLYIDEIAKSLGLRCTYDDKANSAVFFISEKYGSISLKLWKGRSSEKNKVLAEFEAQRGRSSRSMAAQKKLEMIEDLIAWATLNSIDYYEKNTLFDPCQGATEKDRFAANILCEMRHDKNIGEDISIVSNSPESDDGALSENNESESEASTSANNNSERENEPCCEQERHLFIVGRLSSDWQAMYQVPAIKAYLKWFSQQNSRPKVHSIWQFFTQIPEGQCFHIQARIPRTNDTEDADVSAHSEIWERIYDLVNLFKRKHKI